jgi:hypothetical protein
MGAPLNDQPEPPIHPIRPRRRLRRGLVATGTVAGIYLSLAFVVLPACWALRYRHADIHDAPRITWAGNHHPGDPINLALVGTKDEIVYLFLSAGWQSADEITWGTSLKMARASVFKRPYPTAPISSLYLREGTSKRRQDLAFQFSVGPSPRQRHHVRFWQTENVEEGDGRHVWIGSATYDRTAKLNWLDLKPTHGIDGDVDRERDKLLADLRSTWQVLQERWIDDFHKAREGSNGGADRWFTDGRLAIVVISPDNAGVE